MSTSTEYMDGLNAHAEKRFYPRVSPPTAIYVAFGSNDLGVLHNISENGFQVSTPNELALNSVFRVFLSLNGAAKTIAVTVRTIWTADGKKRSGMQLLDLADEDRAQIRQWIEFEMTRDANSAQWYMPKSGDGRPANGNRADGVAMPSHETSETRRVPRVVLPTSEQSSTEQPQVSPHPTTASFAAAATPFVATAQAAAEPAVEDENLPRIANPFDIPEPNSQFPPVPLPIHGDFEFAPSPRSVRIQPRLFSRMRAKPLILWAVALALICFGANVLVRYKISSTSQHYATESAKYTPPKSDAAGPDSSAPVDDSGANAAAAPAETQSATNSANGDNSASTAPSSEAPSTTPAQNDSATSYAALRRPADI